MATIVTRAGKGSPLTNAEVDSNFVNLNNGKVENTQAGILAALGFTPYKANDNVTFGTLTATGQVSLGGSAGAEGLRVVATASSVNWIQAAGSTTGANVVLSAQGSDLGVTLELASKGNNGVSLRANGARQVLTGSTANAVNYVTLSGAATNNGVTVGAAGSDLNVDLRLTSKGTGVVRANGNEVLTTASTYAGTLTSGQVTSALGFTPYNSTNPSGYITSSALSSYLPLSGGTITTSGSSSSLVVSDTGANGANIRLTGNGATTPSKTIRSFNGSLEVVNSAYSSTILSLSDAGALNTSGAITQAGNQVLHAGNFTSYAPSLTGTGASGAWNINARVGVENNGTLVGTRRNINFIPGTGISLSISDDSANEEVDVTITSTVTGGVTSFNTRTGAVTLSSSDVTTALGFTPYNSTNPNGYVTSSGSVNFATTAGSSNLANAKWQSAAIAGSQDANVSAVEVRNNGGSGDSNLANITFHCQGLYGTSLHLRPDGYFGVGGWSATTWRWYVNLGNGDMVAAGNVTAYSDERLKKDWGALADDFVEQLAAVKHGTYTRIDSGARQVGVSAQSLRNVLPDAVGVGEDGDTLQVSYGNAALASAVKLAQRVAELTARLQTLEQKMGA